MTLTKVEQRTLNAVYDALEFGTLLPSMSEMNTLIEKGLIVISTIGDAQQITITDAGFNLVQF